MALLIYPYLNESGSENMATDLWLFQETNSKDPIFRHYGWMQEEITFGYGQDWNWVKSQKIVNSMKLTRRPTGGGIVKHGCDWTYMLIIPRGHSSYLIPALDLYEKLHFIIGEVLNRQGYATSLMPCPTKGKKKKGIPGNCFLEPVGMDLMSEDGTYKLAGAAMKRTRKGILIQGTLDLSSFSNVDTKFFSGSFLEELQNLISEETKFVDWPENLEANRLAYLNKFNSLSWQEKRKFFNE
ncbi:MAG: hypothetical protein HN548_07900 [Opitutae bacterium]|jgi:lipoyl(octanoyl) transferase|nr:hypothetical protein [Opitutae bacterium]